MEILPQLLINALIAGSIYALASSGLALTYGLLRILNFAHGHLMMVGAYCFYALLTFANLSIAEAALGTIVFSIAFGSLCLWVFILPFSKYSFLLTFVTTIALSSILEASVSMLFGVNVKSLSVGGGSESIQIGSVYITPIQIIIITSALLLLSILSVVIHASPFGRKIRALSENPYAAESLGVNKTQVSYCLFILGTIIAAYAGILVGYETNMQPTMGASYTIKAFAAMILGGLGNLWGTVAGSYILGLVENLSIGLEFGGYSIPAGYKDAFAFFIILLVLLVRPEGLFSHRRRKT